MEREPWERQKGETRKAYEAFSLYRDGGPTRSYQSVANMLSKSLAVIKRWGSRWNWVERSRLYQDHLDSINRFEQEQERKDMLDRHARIATAFQVKIMERLRDLIAAELTPQDLARWFDVATKIERLARGEPTEAMEVKGRVEHLGSGLAYEIVSDAELAREIQEILRARLEGTHSSPDAGGLDQGYDERGPLAGSEGDSKGACSRTKGCGCKR